MDNESEDFDLTQSQKSRLLSLGLEPGYQKLSIDPQHERANTLYDVLSRTLPIDPTLMDSLPSIMKKLSSRLRSLAGQPIGELLQNPGTNIVTIKKIKQHAKDLGTSSTSEAESDVLMAVYYAAIASALTFHSEKITQHSYKNLESFFNSFTRKEWMLGELIDLFNEAQKHCQEET